MIVVDRIEGHRAVLLVGDERLELPLSALPVGTREGDVLKLVANADARQASLAEAEDRLARLKKRAPQGPENIDL